MHCVPPLHVVAIPHTFVKKLEDVDVVQNNTAEFECVVRPPWAPIRWFYEGEEVQESRRFHILEGDDGARYLDIEHALRSDMGTVSAKLKDDECEAQLNVAGNEVLRQRKRRSGRRRRRNGEG